VEERKSVLETTAPSDALGRLKARTAHSRTLLVIIGVVVLIALALLVGLLVRNVSRGSQAVEVPSVLR
jgi:hypothetical protein